MTSTPFAFSPRPTLAPSSPAPTILTCPDSRLPFTPLRSSSRRRCSESAGGSGDRQQLAEFHLSQVAHLARREVAQVQRAELPAHQLEHRVADLLQHPAHDAVASGVQGELHDGLAVVGRADDARLVRGDRPVLQVDAGGQFRERLRGDRALHLGDVGFHDPERRMRQHVRELAVVGEDEQPGGLRIQPADVEQALLESGDEPRTGRGGRARRAAS